MDDLTWGALTLTLTLLGGLWTWFAFRRRGLAAGLRGGAVTLLPAAAWLTGTLELATEVAGSVADWATHLVFSPVVWAGIVLAGLSVLLFGVSGALQRRGRGTTPRTPSPRGSAPAADGPSRARPLPEAKGRRSRDQDLLGDDLSDVEDILRRRGIT